MNLSKVKEIKIPHLNSFLILGLQTLKGQIICLLAPITNKGKINIRVFEDTSSGTKYLAAK